MSKLIMMRGLPASGKSTKSKEICKDRTWVRVNRDLLRKMLHFDVWDGRREDVTVSMEKALVMQLLTDGFNVVVDDTNLSSQHLELWLGIAKRFNAEFSVEEVDTPFKECIKRDKNRPDSVGKDVITRMALQYCLFPSRDKGFVLCDLDGTLCDCEHRRFYLDREPKDWEGFFSMIRLDKPREEVVNYLRGYFLAGHQIIFVSARPERYRKVSEDWLNLNIPNIKYTTLLMRRDDDKRPDVMVKEQIYNQCFKDKYEIYKVIDDRPSVIEMWKRNGLDVIDVGNGVDF